MEPFGGELPRGEKPGNPFAGVPPRPFLPPPVRSLHDATGLWPQLEPWFLLLQQHGNQNMWPAPYEPVFPREYFDTLQEEERIQQLLYELYGPYGAPSPQRFA